MNEPMEQKWFRMGQEIWCGTTGIMLLLTIPYAPEEILDRICADHNFARHAALEIAGKDIKIGVQGKVIAAHKDQIASLQAEIVALTAENERLQGGPDFSTHESIQREFDKRFPDEEDTDE